MIPQLSLSIETYAAAKFNAEASNALPIGGIEKDVGWVDERKDAQGESVKLPIK